MKVNGEIVGRYLDTPDMSQHWTEHFDYSHVWTCLRICLCVMLVWGHTTQRITLCRNTLTVALQTRISDSIFTFLTFTLLFEWFFWRGGGLKKQRPHFIITLRGMRLHVGRYGGWSIWLGWGKQRNAYDILVGKPVGNRWPCDASWSCVNILRNKYHLQLCLKYFADSGVQM
jgi:hypothetical protein